MTIKRGATVTVEVDHADGTTGRYAGVVTEVLRKRKSSETRWIRIETKEFGQSLYNTETRVAMESRNGGIRFTI